MFNLSIKGGMAALIAGSVLALTTPASVFANVSKSRAARSCSRR